MCPPTIASRNYETATPGVQRWLLRVLDTVVDNASSAPIFIHCAAGRDRTGVVVAAILHAIGIDDDLIVADYLMSDGVDDDSHIRMALVGLRTMHTLRQVTAPLTRLLRS
ncbi:MAG TPA: tyrosine-protein phosphatase [Myxococcota bacterium]